MARIDRLSSAGSKRVSRSMAGHSRLAHGRLSNLLGGRAALSYLRYDVALEQESLDRLGLHDLAGRAVEFRDMSRADNRQDLDTIGIAAASAMVAEAHFPTAFDLKSP